MNQPMNLEKIVVGTDDGNIILTQDSGTNWKKLIMVYHQACGLVELFFQIIMKTEYMLL